MGNDACLELIRHHTTLRTSAALAQAVVELIASGQILPGTRLPTVRAVAEATGMSRSAVGDAWQRLGARGLVESRRRGGTIVLDKPALPHAWRYESMIRNTESGIRDLGNLHIVGASMPLTRALGHAIRQPELHDRHSTPITAELAGVARGLWPFETDDFVTTHGVMDGVDLALTALVRPGDAVAIETPSHGRVYDILEALGARLIPIPYDTDGPSLAALKLAMISKPAAFVYQPTGNLPTGRSVSQGWLADAARIIPASLPVLEFSHASLIYPEQTSLGTHLPGQVTHVRSYNLFFGADLRVAVVGGNAHLIEAMWSRLTWSTRFVSRLLQGMLAFYLTDPASVRRTDAIVGTVRRRSHDLGHALQRRGFELEPVAGPMLWIPVPDEYSACTRLRHERIAVHPGRYFRLQGQDQHIVVCSAGVVGDHELVADAIARACTLPHPLPRPPADALRA